MAPHNWSKTICLAYKLRLVRHLSTANTMDSPDPSYKVGSGYVRLTIDKKNGH